MYMSLCLRGILVTLELEMTLLRIHDLLLFDPFPGAPLKATYDSTEALLEAFNSM
jgi:hypothetical protein